MSSAIVPVPAELREALIEYARMVEFPFAGEMGADIRVAEELLRASLPSPSARLERLPAAGMQTRCR